MGLCHQVRGRVVLLSAVSLAEGNCAGCREKQEVASTEYQKALQAFEALSGAS